MAGKSQAFLALAAALVLASVLASSLFAAASPAAAVSRQGYGGDGKKSEAKHMDPAKKPEAMYVDPAKKPADVHAPPEKKHDERYIKYDSFAGPYSGYDTWSSQSDSKEECIGEPCWDFKDEHACEANNCCWNSPAAKCLQKSPSKSCDVSKGDRHPCGWRGMTRAECEYYDCCFYPLGPHEYGPWCFYKEHAPKPVDVHKPAPICDGLKIKSPCHGLKEGDEVTEEECTYMGCCYEADYYHKDPYKKKGGAGKVYRQGKKPKGGFCYAPLGHCKVSYSDRKDCGYPDIDPKTCHSKNCCWHPVYSYGEGTYDKTSQIPWCYYKQTEFTCKKHETVCGYECCDEKQKCIKDERETAEKKYGKKYVGKKYDGKKTVKGGDSSAAQFRQAHATASYDKGSVDISFEYGPGGVELDEYGYPIGTNCMCKEDYHPCGYEPVPLWYGYKKIKCCPKDCPNCVRVTVEDTTLSFCTLKQLGEGKRGVVAEEVSELSAKDAKLLQSLLDLVPGVPYADLETQLQVLMKLDKEVRDAALKLAALGATVLSASDAIETREDLLLVLLDPSNGVGRATINNEVWLDMVVWAFRGGVISQMDYDAALQFAENNNLSSPPANDGSEATARGNIAPGSAIASSIEEALGSLEEIPGPDQASAVEDAEASAVEDAETSVVEDTETSVMENTETSAAEGADASAATGNSGSATGGSDPTSPAAAAEDAEAAEAAEEGAEAAEGDSEAATGDSDPASPAAAAEVAEAADDAAAEEDADAAEEAAEEDAEAAEEQGFAELFAAASPAASPSASLETT